MVQPQSGDQRASLNTDHRPSANLRAALDSWRERLPESWTEDFADVDLAFDEFDVCSLGARPQEFWPTDSRSTTADTCSPFKPLHDLSPAEVRVVIIGRDPYPKRAQATGRSFEQGDLVNWAVAFRTPHLLSTSLRRIALAAAAFREGEDRADRVGVADRPALLQALRYGRSGVTPPDRCFGEWAGQGVLWLNRAATFSSKSEQLAHRELWKPFTTRVLRVLARESRDRRIVVVLWGGDAQRLQRESWREFAGGGLRVITAPHPSAPGVAFLASGNPLARINEVLDVPDRIVWNASSP